MNKLLSRKNIIVFFLVIMLSVFAVADYYKEQSKVSYSKEVEKVEPLVSIDNNDEWSVIKEYKH